jgi:hypothetical protein
MAAVPGATPKTTPLDEPTVAMVASLLLQVPAPVASVSVVVLFTQRLSVPPGAAGNALTVICSLLVQPVGAVYVMNGLPAAWPVTTPVAEPTVASVLLELLHVPPVVASESVAVEAIHTAVGGVGTEGAALTVMTLKAWQPVPPTVNVSVDVPAATPVIVVERPDAGLIVATLVFELTHVPVGLSVAVIVAPTHTWPVVVIAEGSELTDTNFVL